jgi:predicted CXXCH cytochrome family protein
LKRFYGGVTVMLVVCYLLRAAPVHSSNYVDPAVCAGCHQKIAQSFHTTGMGQSVYRPSAANTVEDYKTHNTVYNQASGLYYTMLARDGKFYQRRHELGFDGQETNVVEQQIDYVVGSGNHARTYLHRGSDGRLTELPVSWYTENQGYWAMSPGYDRPDQEDFRRAIPGECMSCHNGLPLEGKYPDREITGQSVFPKEIPEGIDCQRCHGPGGAHVRAALSTASSPEAIRQAIVNPARLSRDRQLEVCMQCHLETSSSLVPNEIRRYGRAIDSYRPGEVLGDYKLYFDSGQNDRFEIVHAAYRMRMSACFRSSQMTCLTCHDPHQSYRSPTSSAHYVAVCQSCHQSVVHKASLPAGTDCLSCHMPKRRTDDVVHAVMTDHYIQRVKPERDLLAPLAEVADNPASRSGIALYYPADAAKAVDNELYLAVAEVKHGTSTGIAHLQSAIAKYSPAQPEFYLELGDGYAKAGKEDEAIHWYREALRQKPDFRPATKQLAAALITNGQFARAIEILQRAVAVPPDDDALLSDLGNAYLHQQLFEKARQSLTRALVINPEQPEAENLLGLVAIQKNDPTAAEPHFRSALRNQPDFAEAHNNLANLLASKGKYEEAQYHFARAVAISPGYAEAHAHYGLLLAIMRQYDRAIAELEESVRLAPQVAQTHDDLGDILAARGEMVRAASEYREAIQRNNNLPDAHYSLASILATQGKDEEAEQEFRISLRLAPKAYETNLGLGLTLMREGKSAEARVQLQKAAESPDPQIQRAAQSALSGAQ